MAFEHLSCEQLKLWLTEEAKPLQLVDIRDKASYLAGHIDGAQHVDNETVHTFIEQADPAKPLVVCCYHGNSSQGAADFFNQSGFKECYSLDGGYETWRTM